MWKAGGEVQFVCVTGECVRVYAGETAGGVKVCVFFVREGESSYVT